MVKRLLPIFLMIFISSLVFGQEKMRVVRTKAVDRSKPVSNVYIDAENKIWVANTSGISQVFNIENGSAQDVVSGQLNVLSYPDGNHNLLLPRLELTTILGEAAIVTSARYDDEAKELWIGTNEKGVYQIKTEPSIQLIAHLTTENSKLLSNHINSIFIDRTGKKWIGTEDGALVGSAGKWDHFQKFFNVYSFAEVKDEVWVSTDDLIWWVSAKGKWTPLELDEEMYEGPIVDLDFDSKGRLWLASEILTHFDIAVDSFKTYGPSEYFTSQFLNRIAVDQDDAVWIATEDKGLYQIEKEDAINLTIHLDQPLSCDGQSTNAQLRAEVFGDDPPYNFTWNDGSTGEILSGIGAGLYAVTVINGKGKEKMMEYEVPDPVVSVGVVVNQPADPEGQNGQATITISGGVPEYSIQWDNGETELAAKKLSNGLHTVIVTDEAGCTAQTSIDIPQEFLPLSIYIEVLRENECYGEENAVINYHANGGQKPYTSEWSNGQKMNEAAGLGAGTYTVTLTDAQGSTAIASVDIEAPDPLRASINVISSTNTNTSDGRAEVTSTGGTPPYQYQWENGVNLPIASNLGPGEHLVTVTDSKGCNTAASVIITEDILPLAIELSSVINNECAGASLGSAVVSVSGGKAPYQYAWNDPALTGNSIANLKTGTYSLVVTDAAGTTAETSFEIQSPDAVLVEVNLDGPSSENQSDGKATIEVSGGVGKYTYKWDSGETGKSAKKLSSGIHQVTVSDQNGCGHVATFEVPEEILPLAVELVMAGEVKCADGEAGGSIDAQVSGGVEPFGYKWSVENASDQSIQNIQPGNYTLTVTDAQQSTATAEIAIESPDPILIQIQLTAPASVNQSNGKALARVTGGTGKYDYEWDSGESSKSASKLADGQHFLTVTDENGCTSVSEIEMTEDILPLVVQMELLEELKCTGDQNAAIQASVSGGKAPFRFDWGNALFTDDHGSNLPAGTYSLTVTDAEGTTAVTEVVFEDPVALDVQVDVEASATTNQEDGKATVMVTGGTGKYQYKWDTGESGKTSNKLASGSHSITVTDENGCSSTTTFEMTEDILPLVIELELIDRIKCVGSNDGAFKVALSGGKTPYSYNWGNNPAINESLSDLPPGTYSVIVTDAAGTTSEAEIVLTEPEPLQVVINVEASATTNKADGKATVNVSGGTGSYIYQWDTGESEKTANKLGAGTHSLTVTDKNGCTAETTFEMTEDILPIVANIEITREIECAGEETGGLKASVSGGKTPFTYDWGNEAFDMNEGNRLPAGTYTLTLTDAEGTTSITEVVLEAPAPLEVTVKVEASANTNESDGKASITATGGTGKYTYQWDTGGKVKASNKLAAGTHSVTVTDENGCSSIATFEMTEDILPVTVDIEIAQEIQCAGDSNGTLRSKVTGGKGPFEYKWGNELTDSASGSNLAAGTYTLVVTDVTGATASSEVILSEPDQIIASITIDAPASTNGKDGKATVNATGGTGKYEYTWDNGETTASTKMLAPGSHIVTVTDKNGCSSTADVEMPENILPLAVEIEGDTRILCYGQDNASLKALVKGGKGPFSYTWSTGATTDAINQLGGGAYSVDVNDAAGNAVSSNIEITEPAELKVVIELVSPANTDSEDGRAKGVVQGGTGTYQYAWDNGETVSEAIALAPGERILIVKDEAGCSAEASIEIKEEVLVLSASINVVSPISCHDAQDGSVSAVISGGKKPFNYAWDGKSGDGSSLTGLGAEILQLTVTDATGQQTNVTYEFKAPDELNATIASKKPCRTERARDGKATLAVTGGTAPYTYLWSTDEETQTAKKLAFGINTVTITDAKGCSTTAEVDIVNKILPDLTAGMIKSGQTIKIEKLQFEADSSAMMDSSFPVLNEIYEFLEDNPFIVIEIGGHTNGLPAHEFCDRLSSARAKTVADYMIAKGINPKRVIFKGYGKRQPIATNQTPEGRRRNQRVEVKILEIEEGSGG